MRGFEEENREVHCVGMLFYLRFHTEKHMDKRGCRKIIKIDD